MVTFGELLSAINEGSVQPGNAGENVWRRFDCAIDTVGEYIIPDRDDERQRLSIHMAGCPARIRDFRVQIDRLVARDPTHPESTHLIRVEEPQRIDWGVLHHLTKGSERRFALGELYRDARIVSLDQRLLYTIGFLIAKGGLEERLRVLEDW